MFCAPSITHIWAVATHTRVCLVVCHAPDPRRTQVTNRILYAFFLLQRRCNNTVYTRTALKLSPTRSEIYLKEPCTKSAGRKSQS